MLACNFTATLDIKEMLEPKEGSKVIDIWIPENMPINTWSDFEGKFTKRMHVAKGEVKDDDSKDPIFLLNASSPLPSYTF